VCPTDYWTTGFLQDTPEGLSDTAEGPAAGMPEVDTVQAVARQVGKIEALPGIAGVQSDTAEAWSVDTAARESVGNPGEQSDTAVGLPGTVASSPADQLAVDHNTAVDPPEEDSSLRSGLGAGARPSADPPEELGSGQDSAAGENSTD
jgi:hypothetical protein